MSPRESYVSTLKILRKQRQQLADELSELDPLIDGLERLAKREASSGRHGEPEEDTHDVLPDHPIVGPYSKMEFVPAAEDYLRSVGIPQSTQEIADALVARGFKTRSKEFKNTAQALLKRGADAGRPLRRIGRGMWAIAG
jgi:hypothetical protein